MPAANDQTPLLSGGTVTNQSLLQRLRLRLNANISSEWADIILILLYFDTGLLDGSAISTWQTFVSMQTGNTIYVGLGIADPEKSNRWLKALVSIICFMFGSMCFGALHRWSGNTRRWVQVTSYMIQSVSIIVAALLVTHGLVDGETMAWANVLSIGLLSFQSSGQAVSSQVMQYSELPTIVLTSVYRDLMSDPSLFALRPSANPKRNRRALAIVMLCAGAACSKFIGNSPAGLVGCFWLSAASKAAVAMTWLLWPAEKESEE